MNNPAEALVNAQRSMAIRQKLAAAYPDVTRFQHYLAFSHHSVGFLLGSTGKLTEALAAYNRAIAIREKLVKANPNVTQYQYDLARSHNSIGWVLRQTGRPVEALAAKDRAMEILRKLVEADPSDIYFQSYLAGSLSAAGSLQRKTGRVADAVASIRQSVTISERLPILPSVDRYNLACAHAQLADIAAEPGSGMTAAEGRDEAERAMHWLRQAVAAGYRNVALMRRDADIDPLRSRPDFQLLMMDLEFPDDPFARGD
jgi:serine/threonine-protein kinase